MQKMEHKTAHTVSWITKITSTNALLQNTCFIRKKSASINSFRLVYNWYDTNNIPLHMDYRASSRSDSFVIRDRYSTKSSISFGMANKSRMLVIDLSFWNSAIEWFQLCSLANFDSHIHYANVMVCEEIKCYAK